ncbi:MAG: hypothetical protein HeimC3_48440 [Candidatus Heimdallarchaeota archaeon LC_3]|nr:MAG: hypothetical protein HeimC3_48440 [Candidatus Heimdallarchaeota archaeon LC_3]
MICDLCSFHDANKIDNLKLCKECLIGVDFIEKFIFLVELELMSVSTVDPQSNSFFDLLSVLASLNYNERSCRYYLMACNAIASEILYKRDRINFNSFIKSSSDLSVSKVLAFPFEISGLLISDDNSYIFQEKLLLFFDELIDAVNPDSSHIDLTDDLTSVRTLFGYISLILFQQYTRGQKLTKQMSLKNTWIKFIGIFSYPYLKTSNFTESELVSFLKSRKLPKQQIKYFLNNLKGIDAFNRSNMIEKLEPKRRPGKMEGELQLNLNEEFNNSVTRVRTDLRLRELKRDISREYNLER